MLQLLVLLESRSSSTTLVGTSGAESKRSHLDRKGNGKVQESQILARGRAVTDQVNPNPPITLHGAGIEFESRKGDHKKGYHDKANKSTKAFRLPTGSLCLRPSLLGGHGT